MLNLSHKKLDVYQISLKLVKESYHVTQQFPNEERFLIVNQVRRAAISVCSTLAEGSARKSKREKVRFYEISRSSVVEVDTQFEISLILDYVRKEQIAQLEQYLESVFRMTSKLISNLVSGAPTHH
jgi:four helix bundle protein